MVSTIQNYQLNNKTIPAELSTVPVLSEPSKNIITEVARQNLPNSFRTTAPLTGRMASLQETTTMLDEAKDHELRNKIIAYLEVALIVTAIVGIALGIVFGGEVALIMITCFGLLAYMGLTNGVYYFTEWQMEKVESRLPNYSRPWHADSGIGDITLAPLFAMFGGAILLPLYEAYTRVSRLQKVSDAQTRSLNDDLAQFKVENEALLSDAHAFYRDHSAELIGSLAERAHALEEDLSTLRRFTIKLPNGEGELSDHIEQHHRAIEELTKVRDFFQQFG